MLIFGIGVGLTYGVLLTQIRRFPVPAQVVIVLFALTALVLAAGRLAEDSSTAQPWSAGMAAGALVILVWNLREMVLGRHRPVAR